MTPAAALTFAITLIEAGHLDVATCPDPATCPVPEVTDTLRALRDSITDEADSHQRAIGTHKEDDE